MGGAGSFFTGLLGGFSDATLKAEQDEYQKEVERLRLRRQGVAGLLSDPQMEWKVKLAIVKRLSESEAQPTGPRGWRGKTKKAGAPIDEVYKMLEAMPEFSQAGRPAVTQETPFPQAVTPAGALPPAPGAPAPVPGPALGALPPMPTIRTGLPGIPRTEGIRRDPMEVAREQAQAEVLQRRTLLEEYQRLGIPPPTALAGQPRLQVISRNVPAEQVIASYPGITTTTGEPISSQGQVDVVSVGDKVYATPAGRGTAQADIKVLSGTGGVPYGVAGAEGTFYVNQKMPPSYQTALDAATTALQTGWAEQTRRQAEAQAAIDIRHAKTLAAVTARMTGTWTAVTDAQGNITGLLNTRTRELVPPPEEGLRKGAVPFDTTKAAENARSGMAAAEYVEKQIRQGGWWTRAKAGAPFAPGARLYRAKLKEMIDVLTRLRTGAALNLEEQKFYESQAPSVLDSEETALGKVEMFKTLYSRFTELGAQQKPEQPSADAAATEKARKFLANHGVKVTEK